MENQLISAIENVTVLANGKQRFEVSLQTNIRGCENYNYQFKKGTKREALGAVKNFTKQIKDALLIEGYDVFYISVSYNWELVASFKIDLHKQY